MDSTKRKSFNANVDLIHGPIFKSLIIFALPLFISNIFQQLYNTVDTMIVGNFLGDASLAAIGSCTSIYDLLVGFALGIGNGLAIVTARSFGSKDEKLLKKSVASSLVIGIVVSIGLTLIGLIFLQPLLHLLNTPTNIIDEAYSYIFFIVLFIIVMFAYNLCAGLMRAIGNSVMPLVFLVVSSVLNIILDLVFITQLNMGVQGAAVATVISQGTSVILCIIYMFKKTPLLIPKKEHFEVDNQIMEKALFGDIIKKELKQIKHHLTLLRFCRIIVTFLLVNFAWIFFRMPSLSDSMAFIKKILSSFCHFDFNMVGVVMLAYLVLGLIPLIIFEFIQEYCPLFLRKAEEYVVIRWATYLFLALGFVLFGVHDNSQFIYVSF